MGSSGTPAAGASSAPDRARLYQSKLVVPKTITDKAQMRPAGTPRHDHMASSGAVIFGGQQRWLEHNGSVASLTQGKQRGDRSHALARRHMRSDVDEVVFGRDIDGSKEAAARDEVLYREAAVADGIRPAGGAPILPTRWSRRSIANPNLQATAINVIFSSNPAIVDAPPAGAPSERGPAGKGHRWNCDSDPHSIELFGHKGRSQFSEALLPAGLVVGDSGVSRLDGETFRDGATGAPTPRSRATPRRVAWADGPEGEYALKTGSFLDDALMKRGAKPAAAQAGAPGVDVAAMGTHAAAAIFGFPVGGNGAPASPNRPPSPFRGQFFEGAAGAPSDGVLPPDRLAPATPRACEGEREVFDVEGDAAHRGYRLANGSAAAAQAAALAPGSVSKVVFGDQGDAATAVADEPPTLGGVIGRQDASFSGAAGVPNDSVLFQNHPSRPHARAPHMHVSKLHPYAAQAEVTTNPSQVAAHGIVPGPDVGAAPLLRLNSETHAATANPVERQRERGRKPVAHPWAGSDIAETVFNDGHPDPAKPRWDDQHVRRPSSPPLHSFAPPDRVTLSSPPFWPNVISFSSLSFRPTPPVASLSSPPLSSPQPAWARKTQYEARLKNDLLRHKMQQSEAGSRSTLRQLSRAVGSGGRPTPASRSVASSASKKKGWVG